MNKKAQEVMAGIITGLLTMTILTLIGIRYEQKKTRESIEDQLLILKSVECQCECETEGEYNKSQGDTSETDTETSTTETSLEVTAEIVSVDMETSGKFEIGEEVPLPNISTAPKLYTDYRCYNLWYTPHYRLQQAAWTDENGLRRYNDDYIVGLGRFYSEDIGDRFLVTLETGEQFSIILGDGKAPCDCDDKNQYTPCKNYSGEDCANVLEFIIDKNVMSPSVYAYGSIDCIDKFKGDIVSMVYLGRDNSADWTTYFNHKAG